MAERGPFHLSDDMPAEVRQHGRPESAVLEYSSEIVLVRESPCKSDTQSNLQVGHQSSPAVASLTKAITCGTNEAQAAWHFVVLQAIILQMAEVTLNHGQNSTSKSTHHWHICHQRHQSGLSERAFQTGPHTFKWKTSTPANYTRNTRHNTKLQDATKARNHRDVSSVSLPNGFQRLWTPWAAQV